VGRIAIGLGFGCSGVERPVINGSVLIEPGPPALRLSVPSTNCLKFDCIPEPIGENCG